jgi:hypothetical protein
MIYFEKYFDGMKIHHLTNILTLDHFFHTVWNHLP